MQRSAVVSYLRSACLGLLALAYSSEAALAQTYPPIVAPGTIVPPQACAFKRADGTTAICSPSEPLPVTGLSGGGGGGSVPTGPAGSPNANVITVQGITGAVSIPVSGTFWQAVQPVSGPLTDAQLRATAVPVSAASLPLPANAATSAGQATNTNAITATQGATGTLAATSQTVTMALPQLSATNRSGVFGTSSAALMPANASRRFIQVQVQSSSASCYINGLATATADQNSLLIQGGNLFESSSHVGTGAISIICTAASTPVFAREG